MTTMTDRCDCPYPDPMTYGGPNPLCPEHGDVDAILASGRYTDRKGREWVRDTKHDLWMHGFPTEAVTPAQLRLLIVREQHRAICPGLLSCWAHPVPLVWWGSLTGNWYAVPAGTRLGLRHPTLTAALDAARHMTGATP